MYRIFGVTAALLLTLSGCDDDPYHPWVVPDGVWRPDGMVPFLATCQRDSDCASGRCIDIGGARKCSQACSATASCPALIGWSCNSQSFCECTATGKQPTVCKIDGDCDGLPDKPEKAEECNGVDDDCNELVDDILPGAAGARSYYRDADGDGFGDLATVRWLCSLGPGWSEKAGDCDDGRKDVNPDATEICGDVYDNDCDGIKEDTDICGLTPIVVPDVEDPQYASATLKYCQTSSVDKTLDITEIVAKQDANAIKFTIRLAGGPALTTCASYVLRFGSDPLKTFSLIYVYRPSGTACGALPTSEVYLNGKLFSSQLKASFNAASPGHVAFTIPKTEFYAHIPTPSYHIKICTNAKSDAAKDLTECTDDVCETPVHR